MDLPNRNDLFRVGRRSIVITPGLQINPKVIDTEGSDVNIFLGASSLQGEEVVAAFADCLRGLFVETAEGSALDRVAFDRYQITRLPAAPATVDLTLTHVAGVAGTVPAGTRITTAEGTQFSIDADVVFTVADASRPGTATALVSGPGGNVQTGTLTRFVDQPFDAAMTVTNPANAAGGVDSESDTEFRSRILGFFQTVRRGTLGAIEFGARQVPGVAVARAIEIENLCAGLPLPACEVELIVADRNGGFSTPMLQAVEDILLTFRAAGIPVIVTGGVPQYEPVTWDIDFETGVDQARVADEIRAVTVAVAQFLRPGEILYRSSLIAGARAIPGAIVRDDSLVVPVGDTVPTDTHKLIRIKSDAITFI